LDRPRSLRFGLNALVTVGFFPFFLPNASVIAKEKAGTGVGS
jgi:hypothetical protein